MSELLTANTLTSARATSVLTHLINQSYHYENMTNYDANNLNEETELKEKKPKK